MTICQKCGKFAVGLNCYGLCLSCAVKQVLRNKE